MRTMTLSMMMLVIALPPAFAQQGKKCFFESECTAKDYSCVTPKGAVTGTCQPKTSAAALGEEKTGKIENSIISDDTRCTFNTDCPDGGQCVKQPGTLYGKCEGSGYGPTYLPESIVDRKRTCYFDQDCRPGQVCTKPQGSFKGTCEEDLFSTSQDDTKDPRELIKNQFRTSNKKCLQDGDCGIREACVQKERSVFGVCVAKSAIEEQNTTGTPLFPSQSSTGDLFKF